MGKIMIAGGLMAVVFFVAKSMFELSIALSFGDDGLKQNTYYPKMGGWTPFPTFVNGGTHHFTLKPPDICKVVKRNRNRILKDSTKWRA